MISGKFPLDELTRLADSLQQLEALFPQLSAFSPPTTIAVVSNCPGEARRHFLRGVEDRFRDILKIGGIVLRQESEPFPDQLKGPIDSIWFLFSSNRYELMSEQFLQWVDSHRELIGRTPFFAMRIFPDRALPTWPEPILHEEQIVAARQVMVSSVAVYADQKEAFHPDSREQHELIALLLAKALKHRTLYRPWQQLVEVHDQAVAGRLEQLLTPLKNDSYRGYNHLDTAILNTRHLFEVRATAARAKSALDRAGHAAASLEAADLSPDNLNAASRCAASILNDLRLFTEAAPEESGRETVDFASDFQHYRRRLLRLIDKLIQEARARGLNEEAQTLEESRNSLEEKITVIMLGAFSSGKSTFLNTLLDLTEADGRLPTGAKPVTGTINILEYSETDEVRIEFADRVELELFGPHRPPLAPERLKVNKAEIEALLEWIRLEAVDPAKLAIERFGVRETDEARSPNDRTLTEDDRGFLCRAVTFDYLDESQLAEQQAVRKVTNVRFQSQPGVAPPGDLKAYFELVEENDVALRVKELQLKRRIKALNGLRFADTPGTDSLIAHHETLTRQYIKERRGSPIIFLFNGAYAGGEADAKNIAFLKSLMNDLREEEDWARIFFAITMRGLITSEGERREVLAKVESRIREFGPEKKRVYFVDSIDARTNPADAEWRALIEALKVFVDENRTNSLRVNADALIRARLEKMRSECLWALQHLYDEKQRRAEEAARLKVTAGTIEDVLQQFKDEAAIAKNRLFRGSSFTFADEIRRLDESLRTFDCGAVKTAKKDQKVEEIKSLLDPLAAWSTTLITNLEEAGRSLKNYLESELRNRAGVEFCLIPQSKLPPDFSPLQLAGIMSQAGADVDRGMISFRNGLEAKIKRLRDSLAGQKTEASRKVESQFENIAQYYLGLGQAIREKTLAEAGNLQDESELAGQIQSKRDLFIFIEECLTEFAAIEQSLTTHHWKEQN